MTKNEPSAASVIVPATGAEPSPKTIAAEKSDAVASGLALVNWASVPLNGWLTIGVIWIGAFRPARAAPATVTGWKKASVLPPGAETSATETWAWYEPALAKVFVAVTKNWPGTEVFAVTTPAEAWPSPKLTVAVKSEAGAKVFGSLKAKVMVAGAPSVAVAGVVGGAWERTASATVAVLVATPWAPPGVPVRVVVTVNWPNFR